MNYLSADSGKVTFILTRVRLAGQSMYCQEGGISWKIGHQASISDPDTSKLPSNHHLYDGAGFAVGVWHR